MSSLLSAAFARAQTCTTLDASVLVTVLLLLGCHGMARGLPAQLRDADGGGRAAALTRESPTIYAAVVSSWKASCRAYRRARRYQLKVYSDIVLVQEIITLCEHAV